ncbi:Putative ankyrin repeat protein RF_0381, partial [Durusdinium trenchii]
AYKRWKKENLKHSDFLNFAKDAPEYRELLDTLFERLQEPKLAPSNDEDLRRLLAAKDVDTQVLIEESHNRPILPNELGEELSSKEQEMLRKIGDEVKRCWFGDAKGDFDRSYGRQAAGYLGHKIWRHLDERAKNLCHQRFVQFSCHDTTMCALAAHFGIELDKIGFGAFFALELHECPDGSGSHFVKFYYNPEPDLGAPSYEGLQPLVLPLGREEKIRPIKDCDVGSIPLHLMEDHCRIEGLEESFEDFVKLLGRADLGPTRSDLLKLLEDGRNGWHDFNEWKELYEEAFHSFDQNGDGLLCKAEMQDAFFNWYGVRGKITDLIFHLVDREPETDALSKEDVYLAMFALVGVRGSISSKTVNKDVLVDILLDDPNQRSGGGVTMLMSAANTGDLNRIRTLVQQGAEVNAQDDFGWTSLRFAVRKGHVEAVQELIEANADVNLCSESGRTPLMSAVANASPNIVQLLVSAGADLEAKNGDGLTAFDIAKRGGGMGNTVIRGLVDPKTSLVVTG